MFKNEDLKTNKASQTKKHLFETAMKLIKRHGFEGTTMRAIAVEAGVAPGAIYYYFDSKESLIHEYYRQTHLDHLEKLADRLNAETSLEKRLHLVLSSKIEAALPYKEMARSLFRIAANPDSELSPFSEQSKELRNASTQLFTQVVEGADDKFDPEIRELLPSYLWLFQMGVILFWIYDSSENSKKTFAFIDQTVPLIASLNQQLMSPLARPFRKRVFAMLKKNIPDFA